MRRRIFDISSSPMALDVDIDTGGNINVNFSTDWYQGYVKFSQYGNLLDSSLNRNPLMDDFLKDSLHRRIRNALVKYGYLTT